MSAHTDRAWNEFRENVLRYLAKQFPNLSPEDLDDTAQLVVVRVFRSGRGPILDSWAYSVSTNIGRDVWRNRNRARERNFSGRSIDIPDPSNESDEAEFAVLIEVVGSTLDPTEASLFRTLLDGYDTERIAQKFGWHPGKAKSCVHRLRKKLQNKPTLMNGLYPDRLRSLSGR